MLTAQSDGLTNAAVGLSELEVFGETLDTAAPAVELSARRCRRAPATGGSRPSRCGRRRPTTATSARASSWRSATASWQASENVRFVEASVSGRRRACRARQGDGCRGQHVGGGIRHRPHRRDQADGRRAQLDVDARSVSATAADGGSGPGASSSPWTRRRGWAGVHRARRRSTRSGTSCTCVLADAAGNVSDVASVTVPRSTTAPLEGNIAPLATATASYTSRVERRHRGRTTDRLTGALVGHVAAASASSGCSSNGTASSRSTRARGAVLPRRYRRSRASG